MKKIIISILLIGAYLTSSAQYDVKWGPTYKKDGGMFSFYYLAGADADNYRLIMKPKKSNTMLTFDYNHKLVKTSIVPFTFDGDNLSPTEFLETSAGNFAILSHYKKKSNMMYEFVSLMSEDGKFGDLKEIQSYEYKVKFGALLRMAYGFGGSLDGDASTLETSKNKNFVLKASSQSYTESKNSKTEAIAMAVYDENFDLVWAKEESFNGQDDDDIDIVQYFIDDEGIVYVGAMVWKDRADREKGVPNYDYKLYKITESSLEEFDIQLEGNALPQDVGIFHGEDDNVYLGGLYSEKGSAKHRANGVFFVKISSDNGEILQAKSYEFTPDVLEGLIRDKKIKKGKGLSNFDVNHLIFSDNGDFSFVAEEYFITEHTRIVNGQTQTYYKYHSNEIIIPRFSEDGSLVNIQKIDKDFTSLTPTNTSYVLGTFNDKIYLVFNDAKTKSERKDDDVKGGKNSRFTDLVVVDGLGEISFWETLFSNKEIDTEFWPALSQQVKDTEIILLHGAKKKEYQFATIVMD